MGSSARDEREKQHTRDDDSTKERLWYRDDSKASVEDLLEVVRQRRSGE